MYMLIYTYTYIQIHTHIGIYFKNVYICDVIVTDACFLVPLSTIKYIFI